MNDMTRKLKNYPIQLDLTLFRVRKNKKNQMILAFLAYGPSGHNGLANYYILDLGCFSWCALLLSSLNRDQRFKLCLKP